MQGSTESDKSTRLYINSQIVGDCDQVMMEFPDEILGQGILR